jgi:MATE family multidrug resistance protein
MAKVNLKTINRLAIPAIVSGIAEPLISLVDTAVIGSLGTLELAGVGIASSFFLILVWTLAQTKTSISAIVSEHVGRNALEKIDQFIPQAIVLNFLLGTVCCFVTLFFSTTIFSFYDAEGALLDLTERYFHIRAIGFPLTLGTFAIFGVFRGKQNTRWAMEISLIGGGVNLVFDLLLVFGIEGFLPPLGVEGAAWASVIAQLVMFVFALFYLSKKTSQKMRRLLPADPLIHRFLSMSSNLFIRTIALNIAYFLAVKFATSYGNTYIAAHTIAMNIWLFSAFFIDGYASAGSALSGLLLGKNDFNSLYHLTIRLSKINLVISMILAMVYASCYSIIGPMFTSEKAVLVLFNAVFWMVILSQPINSIAFTFDGIFKGLGEAALLRNALLLSTFFGFVPAILVGHHYNMGLTGIWIAFIIWTAFRGGYLYFRFLKKYGAYR